MFICDKTKKIFIFHDNFIFVGNRSLGRLSKESIQFRGFMLGFVTSLFFTARRPLGRPRRRWVDNIKMDLREIGWIGMDWIDLAQDKDQWRALVNAVMNLRVP
jgi:hypothetical protein